MKRKMAVIVSLAMMVGLLACGSSGGGTASSTAPASSVSEESKAEAAPADSQKEEAQQEAPEAQPEGEGTFVGADYSGDPIVVKAAHTGNDKTKYQTGMLAFKDYVESHSNGKYTVEVYPQTLGSDVELLEGLQIGTCDFAEVNTSVMAASVEDLKALNLPFIFESRAVANAVLDGEIGDRLRQEINDYYGIYAICYWENGFRNFTNDVRPITKPEDLKDLKMRVMDSDIYKETFQNWGCNISAMSVTEMITAMQSGVIDGHDNNTDTVVSNSMWEYQKYYSDSQHFYASKTLNFSPMFWEALSAEEQQMFTEAAYHARDVEREDCARRNASDVQTLKDNGMEVVDHDDIDIAAFKESVKPIWDKYEAELGDLISEIQEAASKV